MCNGKERIRLPDASIADSIKLIAHILFVILSICAWRTLICAHLLPLSFQRVHFLAIGIKDVKQAAVLCAGDADAVVVVIDQDGEVVAHAVLMMKLEFMKVGADHEVYPGLVEDADAMLVEP